MARVTASFTSEADMQSAVGDLLALGLEPEGIRVITPPAEAGEPEPEPLDEFDDGAVLAGVAGLGIAMGAAGGASLAGYGGMGYPAGAVAAVGAGVAAGALLSDAFGDLRGLGLDADSAALYRQRLREGSMILAITPNGTDREEIASVLNRHNGADVRGGGS